MGLRWSDLDWQTRKSAYSKTITKIKGGFVFSEPKSAAGRRVIVLGEETIKKLRQHLEFLAQERREAGEKWQENDLIFPSSIGTPWDHRNMFKYYKIYLKKAGLPDFRFHDLRHTAATLMLNKVCIQKWFRSVWDIRTSA